MADNVYDCDDRDGLAGPDTEFLEPGHPDLFDDEFDEDDFDDLDYDPFDDDPFDDDIED